VAGETPSAHEASRRRRLRWQDDKSTDKIYASGNRSAVGNQSPSEQRSGGTVNPTQKADDKSADKYYAEGGSDRRKVTAARKALGPPPKLALKPGPREPAPRARTDGPLEVTEPSQINGVMAAVVSRLQSGEANIVVSVQKGNTPLLNRVRVALDMLVTRETITEDQARDVRLSYTAPAASFPPPEPAPGPAIRVEDNEEVADPLAFLNGEIADPETAVSTEAVTPVEVDTTNDPLPATAETAAKIETPADDDEDSDFGKPRAVEPVAAVSDVTTEVPAEAVTPEPVEEPRKRGRRSGRGSD